MERDVVWNGLNSALDRFLAEDLYLLEKKLSERCMAARLAFHLQGQFPDHKVDVEYNRKGGNEATANFGGLRKLHRR
jgi:hypothetical protein